MVLKNRSSYSYDSRNRLSLADEIGRYAADAREMGKAATYASLDATGSRAMSHVSLDAEIRLDQGAASVGIDLGASYEVATITATPLSSTHRVTERNLVVFVSTYGSDYAEVDDWSFATLEDGSLYIRLAEPVKARYVKLHCRYDERDADGSVHDVSMFGNAARSIVTVGYHETSRRESFDYDDQGNRLYVYDKNGNMKTRGTSYAFDGDDPIYEHDDYYRAYEYDLQNRLVKVSGYVDGVLSVLATYTYAGDNLRLTKTASGITTRYVHGVDGNELYRSTASDSVSTVWLFGRKLVEIEPAGGVESRIYLHTDHLGSVVAATDEAGATIWLGDNSAFGVATADVGLESRTASYTGKDYDSEAGLYYFNARWYDSELGRFTTEDPVRDDVNWYVYCANRPMTNVDPTGLDLLSFTTDYLMGDQPWLNDPVGNSSNIDNNRMRRQGCAVTGFANIINTLTDNNVTPETINETESFFPNSGDDVNRMQLNWERAADDYNLDYERVEEGIFAKLLEYSNSDKEYGVLAQVRYSPDDDDSKLHFVGVSGVTRIDGVYHIEIDATSVSDSISANRRASWIVSEDRTYVPLFEVESLRVFSAKEE